MNFVKRVSGYCPTQGREYDVCVQYIETSTVADEQRTYTKGRAECEYNCFGDKCHIVCPIAESAPKTL
ncbi:MAG: hypothetical protein PHP22_07980 [Oscillospiraceae bacterium]|nr:hypothetical protein [Oscillospiraceae bacterium]